MKRREFIAKCGAGLTEMIAAGLPMVGGAVPVRSAIGARQIETTDGEESDRPYKRELPWIHSVSGLNYFLVNWPASTENYQRVRFYFGGNAISEQGWFFCTTSGSGASYLSTVECYKNWSTQWVFGAKNYDKTMPNMNLYAGQVLDFINDDGAFSAYVGNEKLDEAECGKSFEGISAILCRRRYYSYEYSVHCRVGFFQYWCSKAEMFSDCRPVIMKDGQVGYYDLIREQFYPNAGTGVIATP